MKKLLLLLSLSLPVFTFAQPLSLDAGFGNNGAAISLQTGWSKIAHDLVRQPDGRILAAGMEYERDNQFNYQSLVTRFLPDGKIDSSFGTHGSVRFDLAGKNTVQAIALQPDGKIVLACNESIIIGGGNAVQLLSRPFIARLNANGTFDNSFGNNGIHRLEVLDAYTDKELAEVVVLPDGKILAGGSVVGSGINMLLLCLNTDGSYNNNFGVSGKAEYSAGTDKYTTLWDMAVQADGKIVIAGSAENAGTVMPGARLFTLGRVHATGMPDAAFGIQGMVVTQVSPGLQFIEDIAKKVALQPDGKICVAGVAGNKLALARYLSNGSPDPAFGQNGTIIHEQHPAATGLVLSNGKLYTSGAIVQNNYTIDLSLSAFDTDGSPDLTFAPEGNLTFNIYKNNYTHALLLQPDGKLVTGGSFSDDNDQGGMLLSRFKPGNSTSIDPGEITPAAWTIYPSPADDVLNLAIRNKKTFADGDLYIFSASGRVVYTAKLKGQQMTVPVKHLAAGIYALRISSGKDSQTLKFVKK